ncbi:MAG TPA: sigma-70 family RNA polymerase sigma factor [Bryobacteraceae bacterium]
MSGKAQLRETGLPVTFEAIFQQHYRRVYGLLIRLVGERAQAEDLANEVFCKLYDQPDGAPVWANPAGWLYRAATNAGIDALRAAARRRRYEAEAGTHLPSADGSPLDSVLRAEQSRQIRAVLGAMKPAQAQILLMRADGCSYKELAEASQVAASGVGTLLNRAEAEFRKRYLKLTGHKEVL